MLAKEYLARKRARKRRKYWRCVPGMSPPLAQGSNGFIMSGTTADIATPEQRHAIAMQVLELCHALDI